jgi:hypothetical protein
MKEKDGALIEYIISNTENHTLRWEPTAYKNQFLVALRGEYTAMIEFVSDEHDRLTLRNNAGIAILQITGEEDARVNRLFELARRNAYNVDRAIDEILGSGKDDPNPKPASGIEDEDIPF